MPTIFEQFMQGRQLAQQQALQQLKMQQAQQLFPIEQQLKQLQMERERQMIAVAQQKQEQLGIEQDRERTVLLGSLAEQAMSIEDPDIRNTFIMGAAQKAGVPLQDASQVTDEQLMQLVAAKQALKPSDPSLGRFQASVVGNKVFTIDSVTGRSEISNLGEDVFRPEGMTDDDYQKFRMMSPKDQSALLKSQVDPKTKEAERERLERIKTAQDLQRTTVDIIDSIINKKDILPDVLGPIEGRVDFRLDQKEADLITDIKELSNILLSDKLSLMSGVLSETDIKILQNIASGGLDRVSSIDRFLPRLNKIRDAFMGKVKEQSDLPSVNFQQDEKLKRRDELRRELGL